MGSGFCLAYPVTQETIAALARFPRIAKSVEIPTTGRSELEIVRLLGNTHYPHLDRLLAFIDRELPASGEIGARAVKQTDPFHMNESLAELFLFAHLRTRFGADARPAVFPKNAVGPEIEVTRPDFTVKIEVYSPLDLAGYQLVTEHIRSLFKYIDVSRGFRLEVAIEAVDDSVGSVWYPYTLPAGDDAVRWLHGVRASAQTFLNGAGLSLGDSLGLVGPGGSTRLSVMVQEVFDDPLVRLISFTTGGRSTDARLLFECGTPEYTAASSWGQKLKTKMRRRQAGLPTPGVVRLLVLNFAQADTGWPDFYAWPEIATRIDKTVRLLATELTSGLPYDVVVPARLDLTCDFGIPIWLDASLTERATAFLRSAGIQGEPRLRSRCEPNPDELAELLDNGPASGEEVGEPMSKTRRMNQSAIETFITYFANQLRLIGDMPNHQYRKTLFVTLLDTLSRVGVPELKDKNRERFVRFVDNFGDWAEAGRVSLPQLVGTLAAHPNLTTASLVEEVHRRLQEWKDGRVYHATDDPLKDELLTFADTDAERTLVEAHTHVSLLWVYRNVLVHEFREPGYDMGVLGDDPSPYYMGMDDEEGQFHWELAYPTTFFAALVDRALENLRRHLEVNDIDPYALYEFGSIWKSVVLKHR